MWRSFIGQDQQPERQCELVSEVYHVIDGSATLVLSPDLIGKERRPADETTVRTAERARQQREADSV